MRLRLSLRWLAAALGAAPCALAAGALPAPGQPIQTSAYSIDFFQGPVLDSVRVTSLSGAYAPIAEGVEGMRVNTAAPAVRPLYSYKNVDFDLSFSFTSPGSLQNTDFDNNGVAGFTYSSFVFGELGGILQFGPWGIGVALSSQRYTVSQIADDQGNKQPLDVVLGRFNLQAARTFFNGELATGLGLRGVSLGMETTTADQQPRTLVDINGAALEAGLLWMPHGLPMRIGLSSRTRVEGVVVKESSTQPDASGDLLLDGRYLPRSVVLPGEIELGFAYQLGARPLNAPWPLPPERYRTLPRGKVLLTSSLLFSGAVPNAIGVEAFLAQKVERSGERVSVTPRVGVETEPVEGWLQVRAGSYLEPSRYAKGSPRTHGTLGVEARLFPWTLFGLLADDTWWRASGFIDVSSRYLGWGVSVGLWH